MSIREERNKDTWAAGAPILMSNGASRKKSVGDLQSAASVLGIETRGDRAIKNVLEEILMLRHNDIILLLGETGVGKTLIAKLIDSHTNQDGGKFVEVPITAIPEELRASALFGHKKGAFTSAARDYSGAFSAAKNGTIFLDEIGEASSSLQSTLLSATEPNAKITPVGGNMTEELSVTRVFATNATVQDLQQTMRGDLLHRFQYILTVPPFRVRNAEHKRLTAERILTSFGTDATLSRDAIAFIDDQQWRGNVRELVNVLRYASRRVNATDGREIRRCHLEEAMSRSVFQMDISVQEPASLENCILEMVPATQGKLLDELERTAIFAVLRHYEGNKCKAAATLGIQRSTVNKKLKQYGTDVAHEQEGQ